MFYLFSTFFPCTAYNFFIMEKPESHFVLGNFWTTELYPALLSLLGFQHQTSSFHELMQEVDRYWLSSFVTEAMNVLAAGHSPSSNAQSLRRCHWVVREAGCAAALCGVQCWWLMSVPCCSSGGIFFLEVDLETPGDILIASVSPETRIQRFQNLKIQFSHSLSETDAVP